MASAAKLSIRTLTAVVAVSIGYGASKVNAKELLLKIITGPGSTSRIVALVVVLLNLKNFPMMWHFRTLGAIIKHMEFRANKFSPTGTTNGPATLFQPTITATRSPIAECDYNLHKSNSTYFSDLDVTRANAVCCVLRDGIKKLDGAPHRVIAPDGTPAKGRWGIMLGAVECNFRKEIAPYEPYELWTRILCWDRKWIYVVSHFVKRGAVKPDGYTLSPPSSILGSLFGRKPKSLGSKKDRSADKGMNGHVDALEAKIPKDAIFASAISKYVMKLGRLTVHPEVVIEASGLLPPRPGGWNTMSGPQSGTNGHAVGPLEPSANGHANGGPVSDDIWDWRRVEAENAKGMEYAKHFAALDGLIDTFTGDERPALGFYRDFL